MPLTSQERQQLLSLKSRVGQPTLGTGGPQQTQFDPGQQSGAQTFGRGPDVDPLRAAGSFGFGLANQAALGIPEAGLRLAGQEPPPFGLLGGARGLGELAGFAVGGPAALARRGFKEAAKRFGTKRLATQALASGTGGAAALGGASVVPSIAAGEPGRIPQAAATGFVAGGVGGPLIQRGAKAIRGLRGTAIPTDEALIRATQKEQFKMGSAARERSFSLRSKRIRERIDRLKEKAQLEASELETGVQTRAGQLKKRAKLKTEAKITALEKESFVLLRKNKIEGFKFSQNFKAQKARLDKAIEGSNFELAKRIQRILPRSMRKVSDNFRALQDEGFRLSRGVRVTEQETRDALVTFARNNPRTLELNPNFVDDTIESLGFIGGGKIKVRTPDGRDLLIDPSRIAQIQRGTPGGLGGVLPKPGGEAISVEQLMDRISVLRGTIPRTARAGRTLYSSQDILSDDIAKALGDVVRSKAPPRAVKVFNEANTLWRNYKPIQREAISDFDPFSAQSVRLKPGMGAIEQAVSGTEPNAITYLKQLERITRIKILKDPKLVRLYKDLSAGQRKEASRLLDQALEREGISFSSGEVARGIRTAGSERVGRIDLAEKRLTEGVRRTGADRLQAIAEREKRATGLLTKRKDVIKADIQRRQKILKLVKWTALAAAGSKYFLVQLGIGSFE